MPDRTPTELGAIIAQLAPGARICEIAPLPGGVSALTTRVDYCTPDGTTSTVIIRQHRTMAGKAPPAERASREHELLTHLTEHGLGVAAPRSRLHVPPDTLVLDFMPGSTVALGTAGATDESTIATTPVNQPDAPGADPDSLRFAREFAIALADIHGTPTAGLPELPRLPDPAEAVREWLGDLPELADLPAAEKHPPSLIHGDYWPGNVLWQNDKITAVLDWEDAALGDPLADVACARAELSCLYDPGVVIHFTETWVAATRADITRLPIWDLYVSTAALAYMADWGLPEEQLRRRQDRTRNFQQQALARLRHNEM